MNLHGGRHFWRISRAGPESKRNVELELNRRQAGPSTSIRRRFGPGRWHFDNLESGQTRACSVKRARATLRGSRKQRHSVTPLWRLDLRVTMLFAAIENCPYLIVGNRVKCDDTSFGTLRNCWIARPFWCRSDWNRRVSYDLTDGCSLMREPFTSACSSCCPSCGQSGRVAVEMGQQGGSRSKRSAAGTSGPSSRFHSMAPGSAFSKRSSARSRLTYPSAVPLAAPRRPYTRFWSRWGGVNPATPVRAHNPSESARGFGSRTDRFEV